MVILERKIFMANDILELCKELPDCCQSFLLETGTEMATTTRIAYGNEINWFLDYLINYSSYFCDKDKKTLNIEDIKMITSQDISRYLTMYKDLGRKERTVARKRAALSRFFTYLTDNRLIPFNPVISAVKVKVHQSDEVIHLNINEQVEFLDAINSGDTLDKNKQKYHDKYKLRDTALILLLLDTGMRVSELQGINIHDIDFDKCSVIIIRKGGNIQTVYFSDDTRDILYEYLSDKKVKNPTLDYSEPMFTSLKGERLTVRAIEKLVKKYAVATLPSKGSHLSPHKMRSSFAMAFYEQTKDILALQRKLGHKNITATNIYAKATDKKMEETRGILADVRSKSDK